MRPTAVGPRIVKLIRRLPFSKLLAADAMDVREALDTIAAAGVTIAIADPAAAGFERALDGALTQLSEMVASAPASHEWPDLNGDFLGHEIKSFVARASLLSEYRHLRQLAR